MGRLTTKSLPQVTARADVGRTTYSGALLTQVTESGVGVSRTEYSAYDNSRRLRKKDSPEGVLTYTYNARGQLATLKGFARTAVIVNGEVGAAAPDVDLEYGYDPLGRLQTVKNYKKGATQNVSTNWYDMAGNLVETSYPNSTRHHWDYTEQNRMKSTVVEKVAGSTATLLRRYDYTLNAAGLRTAVSEKETPTTYYRNMQYKYDYADPLPVVGVTTAGGATSQYRAELPKLNRLTRESIQTPASGVYNSADYTYDLVGNRLKRVDGGLGSGNQTLEYDVKDRVAGTSSPLGFDANGNITSSANGAVTDYYDAENRLVKRVSGTTTITMGYDPSGNRAWKHVQTGSAHKNIYYFVDDLNPTGYAQVMAEYSDTGATVNPNSGTFYAGYEYGLKLISQRHPTSGVLYFSFDGQGSIRSLFNTLGDLSTTYRWDYDAWGKYTLNFSGSIDTHYRYTGEQWDPDLGLVYLRARYYSPEYGRFWSMDSNEGSTFSPRSLNKYIYCFDDPANRRDPSGHMSLASVGTSIATIGYIGSNIYIRYSYPIKRAVLLMYESVSGDVVVLGRAASSATGAALSKVEGGIGTWVNAVTGVGRNVLVAPYGYLKSILARSGWEANHLNQSAAYKLIEPTVGAAVDLIGSTFNKGTQHRQFHQVLERFWSQYRDLASPLFGKEVSNKGYLSALKEALESVTDLTTGVAKFTKRQVDALVELAEKEQLGNGYHDGPGGLRPVVPPDMHLK